MHQSEQNEKQYAFFKFYFSCSKRKIISNWIDSEKSFIKLHFSRKGKKKENNYIIKLQKSVHYTGLKK